MIELEPDGFPKILPLYRAAGVCFPLILSVIEKKQRGQVFVDQPDNPRSALVLNNFGFMSLFEAQPDEAFDEELTKLFHEGGALRPSYLLWYDPPARWQEKLDPRVDGSIKRRERLRFVFRGDEARYVSESAQHPEGSALRAMDHDLLAKARKFGLDLESRFWSSADEFIERALSVCLMQGDEVVSLCYAAAVADGLAEVDVATDPEFRGRGLATIVSQEFIRRCLSAGFRPTWDCFGYNAGSLKLAGTLGFEEATRYSFYSFNVPLALSE